MSGSEGRWSDGAPLGAETCPDVPLPFLHDPDSGSIHVLHVDDEADFGDVVRTYLESTVDDLTVVTETNAEDALGRLESGDVDCIVSDYDMPELTGIELLEAVRADDPSLPFILYTGKGSEEVASDAIAAGVTDYMQKEVGTDQYEVLANRIVNAVERHRAEQELLNTLSGYRRLVEQDLVGIYVIQHETFVYVNEKIADLIGTDRATIVGRSPLDFVDEAYHDRVRGNLRQRQSGEVESLEYSLVVERADGTTFDARVHGGIVELDGDRAIMGVLLEEAD